MTALDLIASPVRGIARNTFRESLGSAPALDYLENRLFVSNTPRLDGKIYGEQPGRGTQRDMQPGRCVVGAGSAYIVGPAGLITTGDFSLSFWFYTSSLASTLNLWGMGNPFNASGVGVTAYVSTAGTLTAVVNDGDASSTNVLSATGGITTGTWHHAAITFDRDGNAQIYLNGTASGSAVSLSTTTSTTANGAFFLLKYGTNASYSTARMFDFRAYNRVLTATEVSQLAILGSASLPNATADLLWHYKLDDTHPTIAWDSSGNDRHGTKTTWVVGTNDYSGADVPFSWQNDVGFTYSDGATYYQNDDGTGLISAGSYLPRLESDKTKCIAYLADGTRASLQYTGEAPRNGLFDQNNCGTFDGVDDYVPLVSSLLQSRSAFTLAARFRCTVSGDNFGIVGGDVSATGLPYLRIKTNTGTIEAGGELGGAFVAASSATGLVSTNTWYSGVVAYDGTNLKIYLNGSQVASVARSGATNASATNARIGGGQNISTKAFPGQLCDIRIYSRALSASEALNYHNRDDVSTTSLVAAYPFSEGSSTTIHDVSGNDNHGTATSIAENTFWGTKQSKFNYTGSHGHTLLTHATSLPIRVPYLVSGVPNTYAIPSGYSKVEDNPAGAFHNNCESTLDLTGGVAYPGSSGITTDYALGDTLTNPEFVRLTTKSGVDFKADRIVIYSEALSGARLAAAQTYTQDVAL